MKHLTHNKTTVLLVALALIVAIGAAISVAASDKQKAPESATGWAERLELILEDESRSAEQRVADALSELRTLRQGEASEDQVPAPQPGFLQPPAWQDPWRPKSLFSPDWDPFAEMQRMRDISQRLFANMDHQIGLLNPGMSGQSAGMTTWSPSGDFRETDDAYTYEFDVPGVGKPEVNVEISDGVLTIKGRRESRIEETEEDDQGSAKILKREVVSGAFERSMPVPPGVDEDAVSAKLDDGVLTVVLPKVDAEETTSSTRKIEIQN